MSELRRVNLGSSFGIMQGRLSPQTPLGYQAFPVGTWEMEFLKAKERGLEHIEWIVDRHAAWNNPLIIDPSAVEGLAAEVGVNVISVCGDIFMDNALDPAVPESFELVEAIFQSMTKVGATHFVLPCVDQASLMEAEGLARLERSLPTLIDMAAAGGIVVALESDLPPRPMAELLERHPSDVIGVNYDSGNSAALGYVLAEELQAYGSRINLVHIKDRPLGGASVPLGSGVADIPSLLKWASNEFRGPVTLQMYRDEEGLDILDAQLERLEAILAGSDER